MHSHATAEPSQHARELIALLGEVGAVVSSRDSLDNVLDAIVERAKHITDTDKAVLVLVDERGSVPDLDSLVVRGARGQHPQEWWEASLQAAAAKASAIRRPCVEPHPEHGAILMCSPIMARETVIGLMCAINTTDRPFSDEQIDFIAVLSAFASSAIENSRLAVSAEGVLLASERERISHEIHDGVVQSLFSISLGLENCKRVMVRDVPGAVERLDELQTRLGTAMTELRRAIYDLRSSKLAEFGLPGAVEFWVREVTAGRSLRGNVVVSEGFPELTPVAETCLYRVAKEAISNVARHSGAAEFTVNLACDGDMVLLEVSDDGCGFDVSAARAGGADGVGLKSIRDRITCEGGRLIVRSAPGSGTLLRVTLPVGGAAS